jgi:hypothetical protein
MSSRLALLVGAALMCGGCAVSSDIGKTCVLVRKATKAEQEAEPTREPSRNIMESQLTPGQDFISFGSVECEDLVCVRDAHFDPKLAAGTDLTKVAATGYCSKPCLEDTLTTNNCAVTSSEALAEVKDRMACRPLLLDQQALDALRTSENPADRALYSQLFGDNTSPSFCAATPPATTP